MLSPLPCEQAHAAGGCVHQNELPGLDRVAALHQVLHRHAFEHAGGQLLICDEVGRMQQACSRVIAMTGAGTEHRAADVADAVTHFEICHTGADFFNHAGRFSAQPRGQLDRVHARADINVLEVKTNGGMANSHFALRGFRQI